MSSFEDTPAYQMAKRITERSVEMQRERDSTVPVKEILDIEQIVWDRYQDIVIHPPVGDVGLIAIGWTALVVRQTHFVFNHYETEFRDILIPNVRTAFEHSVYVALLADRGIDAKNLERLDVRMFSAWRELLDDFDFGDGTEPIPFSAIIPKEMEPHRRNEDNWLSIFEQACAKFEESESLYTLYKFLSSSVHPNFQSAAPYILPHVMDRDSEFSPGAFSSLTTELLTITLGSTAWALSGMNVVLGTNYFADLLPVMGELSELGAELSLKES